MQSTSPTWKGLFASGAPLQARAVIGGTVYTDISAPVIHRGTMQDRLAVGNVAAASLSLVVRSASGISRSAAVDIEARLNDGVTASEWLPQGTFYISRRARDPVTGLLALECYDALLKANAIWTPSAGEWPRTMAAVTAELAALLEVDLDSRTAIPTGAAYAMSQPAEGATIRDALSTVAQAAGGNWIMTPAGKLRLVRLGEAGDRVDVAGAVGGIDVGPAGSVTGVRSTVDGVVTLAGDDTGIVVDVAVAPVIAAELAEDLVGLSYQPFTLGGAIYDPAAELGDGVRAGAGGEVSSVLCSEQAVLGPAFRGNIAAPDPGELTDEYPYIGGASRTLALAKAAAARAAGAAVDALDQQEIFNRLTDNGAAQGLVLYDRQLYMNATYINAGELSVRRVNFSNYDPPYKVPNEYDPDSLLRGQTVQDGWIVNQNGYNTIGIISCDNAVPLRGKTLIFTLISRNHITEFGGSITYTDEQGVQWEETIPVKVAPAYGREDAEGNLDGATDNGEYEQYSDSYTVPDYADSFYIEVECSGVKSISVSEPYSGNFGLRYGNNIGLNYKGLQVGKFVVDRSGNATFNGAARFNGDVGFAAPLPLAQGGTGAADAAGARANLGVTPANIGAPSTNGTGATGTWGINVTGSAGSVAWGNVSGKPNRAGSDSDGGPAQTVKGAYTSNGGRQNPNYFGVNKVGFLMMNTTVNGNSHYKDWLIMDCYSGNDVGGGVAIGVNRQALGAYIMRSAAARSSWAESAELLGTHNYTSYCPTKTGSGASGTWGISVTGNAANVTGTVAVGHGGTGATTAANARSNLGIHSGTLILQFTNGKATGTFSQFGVNGRPDGLIITPITLDGSIRYDWDNSTSNIVLYGYTRGNAAYNQHVRFSFIAIK